MKRLTWKEQVIPILNSEYKVVVVFGGEKQIRSCLTAWHYPEDVDLQLANMRGRTYWKYGCHPVIAVPRRPKTAEEVGTLAHEACHAVQHILDVIGESRTEEVFAHSVGAIVRGVLSN